MSGDALRIEKEEDDSMTVLIAMVFLEPPPVPAACPPFLISGVVKN